MLLILLPPFLFLSCSCFVCPFVYCVCVPFNSIQSYSLFFFFYLTQHPHTNNSLLLCVLSFAYPSLPSLFNLIQLPQIGKTQCHLAACPCLCLSSLLTLTTTTTISHFAHLPTKTHKNIACFILFFSRTSYPRSYPCHFSSFYTHSLNQWNRSTASACHTYHVYHTPSTRLTCKGVVYMKLPAPSHRKMGKRTKKKKPERHSRRHKAAGKKNT